MTREIRFRYRVKNRRTGELTTFLASIADIENRAFTPNPFGNLDYDILSRDWYTGLKDRTGKEVFEGDILRILRDEQIVFVEWNDGAFELLTPVHVFYGHLWIHISSNLEVIGSIYENPDLLK